MAGLPSLTYWVFGLPGGRIRLRGLDVVGAVVEIEGRLGRPASAGVAREHPIDVRIDRLLISNGTLRLDDRDAPIVEAARHRAKHLALTWPIFIAFVGLSQRAVRRDRGRRAEANSAAANSAAANVEVAYTLASERAMALILQAVADA